MRPLSASLLLPILAATVCAQTSPLPDRPTYCDITVRVRLMNESIIVFPVSVQIVTQEGLAVQETFTRDEGRADFYGIPNGTYRVKVSAPEIEPAETEAFVIQRNQRNSNQMVRVKLKETVNVGGPPAVVPVYDLNVPDKARAELDKAMDAFAAGQKDRALDKINSAIHIYPQYVKAYNNLGIVQIALGNRPAAREAFAKAVGLNDKFAPGYVNLARLAYQDKDLSAASDDLGKALAADPSSVEALALEAQVRFTQGRFADAVADVNKVHSVAHENFADVHLVAAEIYQKEGKNAEALQECQFFLHEAPNSPRAAQVRNAMAVIQARIDAPK